MLITFNNDSNTQSEEDLNLACALTALNIAVSKRAKVHELTAEKESYKDPLEINEQKIKASLNLLRKEVFPSIK